MIQVSADKSDLETAWFEYSRKSIPSNSQDEDWLKFQAFIYGYKKGVQATYSQLKKFKRDEIIVGLVS